MRDPAYRERLIARLARVPVDRDYDDLRLRAEKALALEDAISRQHGRFLKLVTEACRPDMHAAATALLAAHVGLTR